MQSASSSVLLPAPVAPLMANRPAERNGSCSKLTSNSPASDARFLPRSARIFMTAPPVYLVTVRRTRWSILPELLLSLRCYICFDKAVQKYAAAGVFELLQHRAVIGACGLTYKVCIDF